MKLEAETSVQVLIQHIRNDLPQVQSTAAAAREHEEVCSLISKSTSYSNVINKTTGIRYNMTSQKCRDGSLKNQPNWMGMTPQHFHTILTSCAICHRLHKYGLCLLVACRGLWKAVGWVVVGV